MTSSAAVAALPFCRGCGERLEPTRGKGRPRIWCGEACRARHRREAAALPVWSSIAGEFAAVDVVDPLTHRREMIEAVVAVLDGEPAAPAIDRAAQFLVEIRGAIWAARRLETELPPRLAVRFGELASELEDAMLRHFEEAMA